MSDTETDLPIILDKIKKYICMIRSQPNIMKGKKGHIGTNLGNNKDVHQLFQQNACLQTLCHCLVGPLISLDKFKSLRSDAGQFPIAIFSHLCPLEQQ